MKTLRLLPLILTIVGCGPSPELAPGQHEVVYEAGDLSIIIHRISSDSRQIIVRRPGDNLGAYQQKLVDGHFQTVSSMAFLEGVPYTSTADDNLDGHFEGMFIMGPIDRSKITLYDISADGDVALSSPEKHDKIDRSVEVFEEFFHDLYEDPDALDKIDEKIQETRTKIEKIHSEQEH
jgi:hypothetical protein